VKQVVLWDLKDLWKCKL